MGLRRLLFLGLGHLSNGDLSIAADFARQLPPDRFEVGFVTAAGTAAYVRGFGLTAYPLDAPTPERNRERFDELVTHFRPDLFVAADAFTLDYSTGWSGLSMGLLRERYDVALGSFDQYDYPAAGYVVDFYTGHRTRFPRVLDTCDLVIRNSPLNRPASGDAGIAVTRMICGGTSPLPVSRSRRTEPPTIFLANSRWEQVNVVRAPEMAELIRAMPRIIHSHLAALRRPLRVVHVGPVRWEFPIAEQIDYQHVGRMTPAEFHGQLTGADLFLTGNAVSVTLTQAVLAGVPSLLLQNYKTLDTAGLIRSGSAPTWLAEAAADLTVAFPYRVYPWGWYEFLAPVLSDNPYVDCFLTAGVFERRRVLQAFNELLDDSSVRTRLRDRQAALLHQLDRLPSAEEAISAAKLR
ncbi:hypothetical protein GCM10011608_01750 [Micromonospora sonchi]|uniref:Uncharacterized protein n=1 Tax=Micromonospora sonchi TaxID=1763543 RepID=A0A917WQC9_9ACTN|nr:DUF6365 family protein [Micromonospora sonchi]GGM20785.1 hypothetical protein GCM10011608_01750 [Micromonospora sonchi]